MDFTELLIDLGIRVDEDLPPAVIKRIGIDLESYHLELANLGLRYDLRDAMNRPTAGELARSAEYAIQKSVRSAGMLGVASGFAGMFGVPPEALARIIQTFRLAQRIAIIYGHDPESDRGSMHVKKAMSAAWGIDLPSQARADLKMSDLKGVLKAGLPALHDGSAWMARTLTKTATAAVGRKASRWIPGFGAGMALFQARRLAKDQGNRIHQSILRNWTSPQKASIEDAVEITA